MSLIQFLRILWARRAILLAALLACFLAAVATMLIVPKRYQAQTRVMLDLIKPDPVTGQLMGNQFVRAYIKTQAELIKDDQVAGKVVDQLGWANDPAIAARFQHEGSDGEDVRHWLAKQISDNTESELLDSSNILEIRYTSNSPEAARQIVDMIRDAYMQTNLEYRQQAAGKTADWYRGQTGKAETLLKNAEAERSRFAREHGIVLQADDTDIESSRLSALSSQSVAQVAAPAMPVMTGGANPMAAQLAAIDQQIAQAATTLGPNHPVFQSLQRQREIIAQQAAQGGGRMVMRGGGDVNAAYEAQKAKVLSQRPELDQLAQLTRDVLVKRAQYLSTAQRQGELRLQAEVGESGITPMGNAVTPRDPSFPNIPLIAAGSIGLGAALGILLSLIVEMLGRRLRSHDDLEFAVKAPVLAIVSRRQAPGRVRRFFLRLLDRASAERADELATA